MKTTVLKLANVVKSFSGSRVLRGVSLEVPKSTVVLVRGRSGAGKTTLAKISALLLEPDSGQVLFNGLNVLQASRAERSKIRLKYIGYVDQEFTLIGELTVRENIELPLALLSVDKSRRSQAVNEVIERLELKGLAYKYPDELSGGQRQRVAIARALVKGPQLLVADEPFSNLDRLTALSVLEYIMQLSRERGLSAIVTTVELSEEYNADIEYILEGGELRPASRK